MHIRRLFSIICISLAAMLSASAEMLLPFFDFDFDSYIDTYHQLIVNDLYFDSEETPFYSSLEKAVNLLSVDTDPEELRNMVRTGDGEALKSYIHNEIENGKPASYEDIEAFLFNPKNMYSAFVSPTTDSAMSYFGHNFLIFYIEEAPMLSPCINFYAHYEHLTAMGTVFEGLAGSLISYYDFKPLYFSYLDYIATRDRSISFYKFNMEVASEKVHDVMRGLKENSFPNYSFLFYNCSHGLIGVLKGMDENLLLDSERALSPAMGMRLFDEYDLVVEEPVFEFAAWNDMITPKSPKAFKDYYKSISSGEVGFSSEPFENYTFRRDVAPRKSHVSSRFSSLSFNYDMDDGLNHRFELWFKPVFNDFFEQNYVDHEILNLHALNGSISAILDNNGRFIFEGFEAELFSFDSILPFTTLKKRPSFGADLSVGMRDFKFLAESDSYVGLSLGQSSGFWFFGVHNNLSTVPLSYTLDFRNMFGGRIGPFAILNTTDMVLYSTYLDYFHLVNDLEMKVRIADYMMLKGHYRIESKGGIKDGVNHSGGVSLVWNFNIF